MAKQKINDKFRKVSLEQRRVQGIEWRWKESEEQRWRKRELWECEEKEERKERRDGKAERTKKSKTKEGSRPAYIAVGSLEPHVERRVSNAMARPRGFECVLCFCFAFGVAASFTLCCVVLRLVASSWLCSLCDPFFFTSMVDCSIPQEFVLSCTLQASTHPTTQPSIHPSPHPFCTKKIPIGYDFQKENVFLLQHRPWPLIHCPTWASESKSWPKQENNYSDKFRPWR